jgi:hypothetical protein
MNQYHEEDLQEKRKRLQDEGLPALQSEALMEIFDFDSLTLDMNRRNFVTKTQRDMITAHLKEEADATWLLLTMAMGVAVVLAIIFAMQGLPTPQLLIAMAAFMIPLAWYGYAHQGGLRKDMQRLRAMRIDGIPNLRTGSRGGEMFLTIGTQSLPISLTQARALSEFRMPMMRIYYAEHSKQILSAEIVYDEKYKHEDLDEAVMEESKRQFDEE